MDHCQGLPPAPGVSTQREVLSNYQLWWDHATKEIDDVNTAKSTSATELGVKARAKEDSIRSSKMIDRLSDEHVTSSKLATMCVVVSAQPALTLDSF